MNIYIFLNYKFNEKIREKLFNFGYNIIQINPKNDSYIINYLNSISNNNDLISKIKNIDSCNKEIFIKLLLLYFGGGIVINDKIIIKNIEMISKLYIDKDITIVKSCLYDNLFDGFIISNAQNELILNTINSFLENNETSLAKLLYNKVQLIDNSCIINENIVNNISSIYSENIVIAEHHYSQMIIFERYNTNVIIPPNLHKIKIGITTSLPNDLASFYSNGIRQNILYFFELLKNMDYDVKLLVENDTKLLENIEFYNYEYSLLEDIFVDNYNVIFSFGLKLPIFIVNILRKNGVKVVSYCCGNSYLIDSEKILYNQHPDRTIDYYKDDTYDEIWSIPQMYKQNKNYWEIIHRTKCIQVPFIWSPNSIKFITKIKNTTEDVLLYKKKQGKIAIFEPNISLMKWCLPCVLISELTHRKYNNIEHVYITNTSLDTKLEDMKINKFNNNEFNKFFACLDIFDKKKITAEKRYITLDFMSGYADIAISHQWENPLNYLYFDLAWMGWPILHNASLCKDIGYYYPDFNYEEGSEKLNDIIINHDANKTEYMKNNRKIIENYIPTNISLQNKYRKLIENLFK